MAGPLPLLRNVNVEYRRADLLAVAFVGAVVAAWAWAAGGAIDLRVLLACEAAFLAFYAVGSLCAACGSLSAGILFDLPLRLLVGYGVVNTALLVLALVSPLGIVANFCVVVGVAAVLFAAGRRTPLPRDGASLWAVALSVVATTLWCQDSILPIEDHGDWVAFKPWVDGFYHAVHVRTFAEATGAWTLEDFRMAGVPARPYHYGVYLFPAFVAKASQLHSYTAFAGVLSPVGVLFTGLAAYAFVGSLWGRAAGVAAAGALLLLPDGSQQGMQNPFMSYHWLTQISPSATYGLALLAVAWLFVVRGCAQSRPQQLLAGWAVAGVLAAYKLHYVIATSLLLLLVPALFFGKLVGFRKRALWVVSACTTYVVCLALAQQVPGVPLIRFDGSSVGEILHLVHSFATPGTLKDILAERMGRDATWTSNLLFGIPYVSFASLGLYGPVLGALAFFLRRRTPILYVVFPLLLLANFLAMFFGLALDFDSSTPDELQHRPLMIVYFFVVAWIGGAVGRLFAESRSGRKAHVTAQAFALALMVVPATFGAGIHRMWIMPAMSPVRLPTSLLQVAEYMRSHGTPEDVFQDAQFDRTYAISALAERRSFVSHTMTRMPFRGDMIATRSAAVDRVLAMRQGNLALGTARAYGIRWFVLPRGTRVNWPPELAAHPTFEAGPLRLYDFE